MNWIDFSKIHRNNVSASSGKPPITEYLIIQAADNALAISVLFLLLFFAGCALFSSLPDEVLKWAIHAAELCLGVFLGLLKNSISK